MATIPFNLLFCLLLGLCFTACARAQLRSGALPWRSDLLSLVLSFALLSAAPLSAYFALVYPDWSWMYLVDPQRLPRGTTLAVVVLTTLVVPLGYLLGWGLMRVGGERALFVLVGVLALSLALFFALSHRRLSVYTRYQDFQEGLLRPMSQSKLLFALLCTTPLCWTAAVLVGRSLWAQGRWLRQQATRTAHSPASGRPGRPQGRDRALASGPGLAGPISDGPKGAC